MTEQNSPVRDFSFDDHDDDPLEELARIVSGEKKPKQESWAVERPVAAPFDMTASGFGATAMPVEAAVDAAPSSGAGHDLSPDFEVDLDRALNAEFGGAEFEGAKIEEDASADLDNEFMADLGAEDLSGEVDEPYEDRGLHESPSRATGMTHAQETFGGESADDAGRGEADYDLDVMASEEADEASLEDQLMVELGLSKSSSYEQSGAFLSGFEDDDTGAVTHVEREVVEQEVAEQEVEEPGDGFDYTDAAEEEKAVAFEDEDLGISHVGDFKDKFEAEMAINRAAEALNLDSRRYAASDDDDLADLGIDLSIWDTPRPAGAPAATPAGASMAFDEDQFSDDHFDSAFETEMAEFQAPAAKAPAAPAPRATPVRQHVQAQHVQAQTAPAGHNLPQAAPAARHASMFNSEREIDDHFAAVFAEELGFDGPAPVPAMHEAPAGRQSPRATPAHGSDTQDFSASFDDRHAGHPLPHYDSPAMDDHGAHAQAVTHQYTGNYDDAGDDTWPDERPRSGSRGFKLAGIALGLALIVGLGAVSYGFFKGGDTPGEPVVVKADTEPVKTRPEDPGGTTVANQDKAAYERVSGKFGEEAKQERLVSDVEKPVNLVSASPTSSSVAGQELASMDAAKGDARLAPGEQDAETAPTSLQPRRVRTLTVRRDGTIIQPVEETSATQTASLGTQSIDGAVSTGAIGVPDPRPETTAAPRLQPQVTRVVQPQQLPQAVPADQPSTGLPGVAFGQQPTVIPVPATDSLTTQSVARVNQSSEPVALALEPAVEPAARSASAEAGIPLNGELSEWVVQISSQRTPEDAQASYRNLASKFPSLIDGRQMAIQKAEIPDRGVFYRVRIATQSKEDAADFCQRLQNAGGSCFVTR